MIRPDWLGSSRVWCSRRSSPPSAEGSSFTAEQDKSTRSTILVTIRQSEYQGPGEDAMIKRSARSGRPAIHTSALISTHASSTNLATSTNTLNGPDSFSSECRCRTAIAIWCRATVDKGLSDHWREVACDSRSENAPSTGCRCNHARAGSAITLGKVSRFNRVQAGRVPSEEATERINIADCFAASSIAATG